MLLSLEAFEIEREEACELSRRITALGSWTDLKLGLSHIAWSIAKIHIWLLDSWDYLSMCFCGPFLRLSTLVILLVDDPCLQKHERLKGNHWLPSTFSDVYISLLSLNTGKGKTSVRQTSFIKYFHTQRQIFILFNIGMHDFQHFGPQRRF